MEETNDREARNNAETEILRVGYEALDTEDLETIARCLEQTEHPAHLATVLLRVAAGTGRMGTVRFLLEHAADPGTGDGGYGWSPLMCAARGGHLDVVRVLLEAGANVNYCETRDFGETALDFAEQKGYVAVRELLLSVGGRHIRE